MNQKQDHPIRTCLSCGLKTTKKDLLRICRSASGEIVIDDLQWQPGRGAYVCYTLACTKNLKHKKGLNRGFRSSISPDVYQRVIEFVTSSLK